MYWAIWTVFAYNALSIIKDTLGFLKKDKTFDNHLATLIAFVIRAAILGVAVWQLIR